MSVGASVNLRLLDPIREGAAGLLGVALALTLLAIVGKVAAGWAAPWAQFRRLVVGVGMIPRGEVGLIFADIGRRAGILNEAVFGAILLMIMATTFVAPPGLKLLFGVPAPDSGMIDSKPKVMRSSEAVAWRARQAGRVVFTNGVFDLLHPGHVELLEARAGKGRARSSGVNSDASVRRLGKGSDRPVQR